jgi:hypothetical protein
VEVEAIGHVRHKNLVRLLGYCVEGVNRYLELPGLNHFSHFGHQCMHSSKSMSMLLQG